MSFIYELRRRQVFRAAAWYGGVAGLAVLPFANLSPDPEDAWFADGPHEEILATLARAARLRCTLWPGMSPKRWRKSKGLLSEAIQAEPGFALALALRSKVRTAMFAQDVLSEDAARRAEGARADFERALALQPELPAALVARGRYELWAVPDAESDPARALVDLTRALEISPNDADTHWTVAVTLRRLGRFDEALEHFEQAAALTPGVVAYAEGVFQTLHSLGRLAEAERARVRLLARYPDERWLELARHYVRFLASGDTTGWRATYDRLAPDLADSWRDVLLYTIRSRTGVGAMVSASPTRRSAMPRTHGRICWPRQPRAASLRLPTSRPRARSRLRCSASMRRRSPPPTKRYGCCRRRATSSMVPAWRFCGKY